MVTDERRRALGAFLRVCREGRQPEDVGLPRQSVRRRGKGLRREDVAALADISTTWYTWIEQGRDVSVSRDTLDKIADVLGLDLLQRDYLYSLARRTAAPTPAFDHLAIAAEYEHLLGSMMPNPMFIVGMQMEILASNLAARSVFFDDSALPSNERNLVKQVFANPELRGSMVDWETYAMRCLGMLRRNWARFPDNNDGIATLIASLGDHSPEIHSWWRQHDLATHPLGCTLLDHPRAGRLSFRQHTLEPVEHPGLTLLLYIPSPENDTGEKVRALCQVATSPV